MVHQEDSIAEEDVAEVPVVEGGVDEEEQEQGLEDQDLMAGETLAQEEGLVVREDQEGRGEGEVVEEDRSSDLSNGAMILLGQAHRKIVSYSYLGLYDQQVHLGR